jgi:hypothetical protein
MHRFENAYQHFLGCPVLDWHLLYCLRNLLLKTFNAPTSPQHQKLNENSTRWAISRINSYLYQGFTRGYSQIA